MCVCLQFRVCLVQGLGWFAVLGLQKLILHLGNVFSGCSIHAVGTLQPYLMEKSWIDPVHLKNKCSMKNIYLRKYFQIVNISSVKHDSRAIWTSSKSLDIEKVNRHHENFKNFSQNCEIQAYKKRNLYWKLLTIAVLAIAVKTQWKLLPEQFLRHRGFLLLKLDVRVSVLLLFFLFR